VTAFNGRRVVRQDGAIFVPLPRASWEPSDAPCSCGHCEAMQEKSVIDTVAIAAVKNTNTIHVDTTWTVHAPHMPHR